MTHSAESESGQFGLLGRDSTMVGALWRHAILSPDGTYRYRLTRRWGLGPGVLFVMLNPSTADAERDDPTIRRCFRFARDWGYDGLTVCNLFAYRVTDPKRLPADDSAVGPSNNTWLTREAASADLTIAAWGAHPAARRRSAVVMNLLGPLHVLGLTKRGDPRHPLYMPLASQPMPWSAA